jgi:phosphoenolpyruvate---glycerone phosphotransferase subunit DhaK
MRKFLVTPENAVESALAGILAISRVPLERVEGHFGLLYRGNTKRKVRLVVGGGSGHEPLFLGAVGPGMADAAVAGAVFAAPNPMSIQATAEALGQADGIIYMYGNYSGDVLNFDFAAEESERAGAKVAQIRIHDDIASAPPDRLAARRGTAGDIYVLKCTAAASDQGLTFDEVVQVGEKVNAQTRSLGVALAAASSIETGQPMFDLPLGSLEIGMGLHGEMGVSRSHFEAAETLVPKMVDLLLADYEATKTPLDRVALMINALGGTTVLELLAVAGHVRRSVEGKGLTIARFEAGEFATSLDMAGFSITMLPLDEEIEPLLDADCDSVCYARASVSN